MTANASSIVLAMAPKSATTGSKGFYASEKVVIDGKRYQGQASAWLIGSKNDPKAVVTTPQSVITEALSALAVAPKVFQSKKRGFYGCTKILGHNNERYQATVQLVELA